MILDFLSITDINENQISHPQITKPPPLYEFFIYDLG